MALVKCMECGKMVSEYAAACPNCGCPMSVILEKSKVNPVKKEEQKKKQAVLPSGNAQKDAKADKLVNYRSLCKIPEDVLQQAGNVKSIVKTSVTMPIAKPTAPKAERESTVKNYTTVKVGDYIKFGRYKQDNDTPQDIEWRVLAKEGNKILVISRYGLDCQKYHQIRENVTWETCTLRNWLNTDFIKSAFNLEEYLMIEASHVQAAKNPKYKTKAGSDTWDKLFLLSTEEVEKYFATKDDMKCQATRYATRQGAYSSGGKCWWWLRTPGDKQGNATFVQSFGGIDYMGSYAFDYVTSVRPAMWINLLT